MHFFKLAVRRLSMNDLVALQQRIRENMQTSQTGVLSRIMFTIADYAKFFLLFGVILFKLLEWWYASEDQIRAHNKLPIPPPPEPLVPTSNSDVRLPLSNKLCPLCRKIRTNPACIPSGYVFCYPCIFEFVSRNSRCPLTSQKCSVDVIRTIYETN
jgi:hypothetical protein